MASYLKGAFANLAISNLQSNVNSLLLNNSLNSSVGYMIDSLGFILTGNQSVNNAGLLINLDNLNNINSVAGFTNVANLTGSLTLTSNLTGNSTITSTGNILYNLTGNSIRSNVGFIRPAKVINLYMQLPNGKIGLFQIDSLSLVLTLNNWTNYRKASVAALIIDPTTSISPNNQSLLVSSYNYAEILSYSEKIGVPTIESNIMINPDPTKDNNIFLVIGDNDSNKEYVQISNIGVI
jgi:hypothetical protein